MSLFNCSGVYWINWTVALIIIIDLSTNKV
jgi:predicted secreted protein